MKRKQIYIEEEQERAIKRIARERGVSEAVVIREAMDAYLAEERAVYDAFVDVDDIIGTDRDPIVQMMGIGRSSTGDGSRNYKRDLYGAPERPG